METDAKKVWAGVGGVPKPNPPSEYFYANDGFGLNGQWYVYVPSAEGYLHTDGIIRENTGDECSKHTGWYQTEKEADAAIELYYKSLDL